MTKEMFLNQLLPEVLTAQAQGYAYAPANIALAKYWGKRDADLNLPCNGSLSLSLAHLGTHTAVRPDTRDTVILNHSVQPPESPFFRKVIAFVNLFRRGQACPVCIDTVNTIPTAAGLASSASGFAALTLALNDYWQLKLPDPALSAIARLGSGSAARSLWHGFVKWEKGVRDDGADCCAHPIPPCLPTVRLALVKVNVAVKHTSSRDGMIHTAATSPLFRQWPETAEADLHTIEQAIYARNFTLLGQTAEANALTMHATMLAARPALSYLSAASFAVIERIRTCRERDGRECYFTMDAGPNVKILYQAKDDVYIRQQFPQAMFINPFQYPDDGQTAANTHL